MRNLYEVESRERKVRQILGALHEQFGSWSVIDTDQLAATPAELRGEYATLVAGVRHVPSDEAWAIVVQRVAVMASKETAQKAIEQAPDYDPFNGL